MDRSVMLCRKRRCAPGIVEGWQIMNKGNLTPTLDPCPYPLPLTPLTHTPVSIKVYKNHRNRTNCRWSISKTTITPSSYIMTRDFPPTTRQSSVTNAVKCKTLSLLSYERRPRKTRSKSHGVEPRYTSKCWFSESYSPLTRITSQVAVLSLKY